MSEFVIEVEVLEWYGYDSYYWGGRKFVRAYSSSKKYASERKAELAIARISHKFPGCKNWRVTEMIDQQSEGKC